MADSEPRQLSRSLNVSTLASKFQQVNTTVHGWQGKPQPVARTESRVSRFSDARAKFQAQAKEKEKRICEEPRKRSPSPGPKTEALVQNFTQLGSVLSTASKSKPCHGDLKDARLVSTWRRSLPDCTSVSTENKENSAQINFCRSNDFLPSRPPSPMHSSFPRPVARVAPGGEEEGCVQQGARQEPPLPLELFPVGALPRTRDRKDQKPGHDPVAVEAKTVPGVFELAKPDSCVDKNSLKQDAHGKLMVKLGEAKRSEEEGNSEQEVGDNRREVGDASASTASCESKGHIAEMGSVCANISKNEDNIFKRSLSKVASDVKELYGEKVGEESVRGDDNANAEHHSSLSEEAAVVENEHIESKAEKKSCSLQKENWCLQISEKLSVARVNEAADILQIEEEGGQDAVQAPQEGSGLTNVAILLAATSDRRKFLDAVGKGGKMLASEENLAEEEGPGIEATFRSGRERLDQEDKVQPDVSGVRTNLRRGRDLDKSTQSQLSNGRRESDACQQPSSLGSSLVGESVGSWLATTSDDLLAINTTKESLVDEKNASLKEAKAKPRVSFSNEVMEILTYSPAEYDRRNRDVDPASAAAEWELEKNVAKLETLQVDLERGCEGLGLAIIGLGTEPVQVGFEKLGIFVRSVTAGGVAARDGRMRVGDQIIEVNGQSLVGVTQAYAASVLRAALGTVSFLVGREKVVEVQVEESQTTVTPESSALEEEESVLGLNSSPDLSSFEVEGGISLLGDISVGGEGKQVDELESGFIQENESFPGLGEEQGEQQSIVVIKEESCAVTPKEQQEVKEAFVLEKEEMPRNVGQTAVGDGVMGEISIASDHEETGGCLERSLAEKYLGLVMELEDTKRQVDSLQQLLKRREEEYRVNVADLTARISCVNCRGVLRKEDEGTIEVTMAHNSFLGIGRSRPEVSQSSPLPAFHSTPNPSPSGTNVLSRSLGIAGLGASFFTVPVIEENELKK